MSKLTASMTVQAIVNGVDSEITFTKDSIAIQTMEDSDEEKRKMHGFYDEQTLIDAIAEEIKLELGNSKDRIFFVKEVSNSVKIPKDIIFPALTFDDETIEELTDNAMAMWYAMQVT